MTAPARLPGGRSRHAPVPAPRPAPPLRLVPQRSLQPPRAPFVALIVGLLAAGLLGLLLLNTVIAEDSFRLHALQQSGTSQELRQQRLQRDIDALEAPNALAARARAMGMVPAGNPAFIRLSDGKVLGVPTPAKSPTPFRVASPAPSTHASPMPARTPKPAATAPFPAPPPPPSPR